MSKAIKMLVDQIIEDLRDRPNDFKCDEHYLTDDTTGYKYWVANGIPFYGVSYPYKLGFGFIQGWRFTRALDKWKVAKYLETVEEKCQQICEPQQIGTHHTTTDGRGTLR